MNEKITKPTLVRKITRLLKCKNKKHSQEAVSDILDAFLDVAVEEMSKGNSIILNGYFTIEPQYRKERKARDVYNNTEVIIPAQYKPHIKVGTKLLQAAQYFTEKQEEKNNG